MQSPIGFRLLSVSLVTATAAATFLSAREPADILFRNGKFLSVDPEDRIVEAIAIRGEKIQATGSNSEIEAHRGPDTEVIDLQGACVIPGLIETHCHSIGVARVSLDSVYQDYPDIAGMQALIRRIAVETPKDKWINVPRVDITRLTERRHPTTAELDAACTTHPVIFNSARKNALNSLALEKLGLNDGKIPEGLEVIRDDHGKIRLIGNGLSPLLARHIRRPSHPGETTLAAMRKVHAIYNSVGITSIFERATDRSGWNFFQHLKDRDQLTVRATLTFRRQVNTAEKLRKFVEDLKLRPREGDDWVRAGPLKITVDGGIHWGTTFLSEPFGRKRNAFYGKADDPDYRGDIRYSVDEMAEVFGEAHRLGWQIGCHVTGDAGVARVFDALEKSDAEVPVADKRFNLIHAYFPSEELAARGKQLGISVDTQSYVYYKDADFISKIYGPDWAGRFIGLGTWYRAGVPVSPNSDHMIGLDPDRAMNSFNPFLMLYVAVTRKDEFGNVHGEHQKLTRLEALRTVTMHAAWQSFDEDVKGSLEPGKLADFVILDRDYLECPEGEIREIRPSRTVIGGKTVFTRGDKAD